MPNITKQLEDEHGPSVFYQNRFYFRDGMSCEEGFTGKPAPDDPIEKAKNQLIYWNVLLDRKAEEFRQYKFQISGTRPNYNGKGLHWTPTPRPEEIQQLKKKAKLVEYIRGEIDKCEAIIDPPPPPEPSEKELSRAVFLARERSRLSQHIRQLHKEHEELVADQASKKALDRLKGFMSQAAEEWEATTSEWIGLDERLRQRAINALCDERNERMIEAAEAIEI